MTTLTEISISPAVNVSVTDIFLTVELADGRRISVPTAWYPRLAYGTPAERRQWTISCSGQGLHWESLDEDISIKGLIAGLPSNENPAMIKKWMESRTGVYRVKRPKKSLSVAEQPVKYTTRNKQA
jgi:Protein of unknown function (DUF2442)